MSTEDYNVHDIMKTIRWALKRGDFKTLRECNLALRAHNDEKELLSLTGEEYDKYHRMLFITSLNEVVDRNN